MLKTIVGVIGWLGTALVFGAVAIRFLRPEWMQYGAYLTWAGLVCILIYMIGQWRDVAVVLRPPPDSLRHHLHHQHPGRARHRHRDQLPLEPAKQALGPDGEPGLQPLGSDEEESCPSSTRPFSSRSMTRRPTSSGSATASTPTTTSPTRSTSSTSTWTGNPREPNKQRFSRTGRS